MQESKKKEEEKSYLNRVYKQEQFHTFSISFYKELPIYTQEIQTKELIEF